VKLALSNSDDSTRALDPLSNRASNARARAAMFFAAGAMLYWGLASVVPYFSGVNITRLTPFFVGAAGFFFGFRVGLGSSLAAIIIHTLVFNHLGFDGPFAILHVKPVANIGTILIGPITGRLHTVTRRLESELARRADCERDLHEANSRSKQIENAFSYALWICSPDRRRMTYASPAFERIYGIPPSAVENDPRALLDIVHPEDRTIVEETFGSSTRESSTIEYRIVRPDGSTRWIQSRVSRERGEDGEGQRIVGVSADVTEGKNAALALQESEEKYRDLVEKIPAVVYVTSLDPSRPVRYVSPQIEFVLGYPQEAWMLDPTMFGRVCHPDDASGVEEALRRCVTQGGRFAADYRLITRNGAVRCFHDEADIVRNELGEPMFLQGVLRDVTASRYGEAVERARTRVLGRLAAGAPTEDVLTTVAEATEELVPDSTCLIALLNRETGRMSVGAFPGSPPGFVEPFEGAKPGPDHGLVGAVIHSGERMVIADARARSPELGCVKQLEESGVRACWGDPILSSHGETLGALVVYLRRPAEPERRDLDLLKSASQLAGITIELRQAQDRFQRSEERYRFLLQGIPDSVTEIDTGGNILLANRLASGEAAGEITGTPIYSLIPDSYREEFRAVVSEVVSTRESRDFNYPVPSGQSTTWRSNRLVPVEQNGVVSRVLVIGTDVTERRRGEEAPRASEKSYWQGAKSAGRAAGSTLGPEAPPRREPLRQEMKQPKAIDAFGQDRPGDPLRGSETVLVAHDEPAVQRLIRDVLEARGYRVLISEGRGSDLEAADAHGPIDLLITDVAAARRNGRELAEKLRAKLPRLKVLFLTGYIGDASVRIAELGPDTSFLSKPFSPEALARKIRLLLDTRPRPCPAARPAGPSPDRLGL
jgi:PAS domain S-box-containing protein